VLKVKLSYAIVALCIFCFSNKVGLTNGKIIGDTLKLVSWNIQMLPDIYSPFTHLVRKKQKPRVAKIIQYLNAANFDVVVLQEVFDIQMEKKIKIGLKSNYPYIQQPIKKKPSIKLSNGVMILSKHPLEYIDNIIFKVSKKSDRMAQKGCVLVKIHFNDKEILIAGTHLDSKSQIAKQLQYTMSKEFIIDPYKSDSIPYFFAGDFNTERYHEDFSKMKELFKLENYPLNDDRPYSYDEYNSWNTKGNKGWIDYIFYSKMPKVEIINQYILRPTMMYENRKMDLADHYQIVLEAIIH